MYPNVDDPATPPSGRFPETRWDLINEVKRGEPSAFEALSQLCEIYWYPVYAFFRDQGKNHHDAQDLTQGLFAAILKRDDIAAVDESAGNFRAFLSQAARNFAINDYYKRKAAKRGSGEVPVTIDEALAAKLYRKDRAGGGDNPAVSYDQRWAHGLLDSVRRQLRDEFVNAGKEKRFKVLEPLLEPNSRGEPMGKAAKALGMSEVAARVQLSRMRSRFGELLRMRIGALVAAGAVQDEINYLYQLLGRDTSGWDWLRSL